MKKIYDSLIFLFKSIDLEKEEKNTDRADDVQTSQVL